MTTDTHPPPVQSWVRLAAVALGLPTLVTGLWAVAGPQHWFDHFPGFDPRLVAAHPPYNEHLATDAGAGLLASGVVLLAAAFLGSLHAIRVGLIGYAAFAVPHTAWHVFNPADGLTAAEDVTNAMILVFSVAATVGLYLVARPSSSGVAFAPGGGGSTSGGQDSDSDVTADPSEDRELQSGSQEVAGR